jgi:hypothetical protein
MMRPSLTLAVLTFALPMLAMAQSNRPALTGTVTDSSGRPVRAVVSQILEGHILAKDHSAWTDSSGAYSFATLSPGVISLVVLAVDYAPARRDSVVIAAGKTVRVDFRLRPQVWCDIGCDGIIVPHPPSKESY